MKSKLERINLILNLWDPIGLNTPILDEYLEYSKRLLQLEIESNSVVECLEVMLLDILGSEFDVKQTQVQKEIKDISENIKSILNE